MSHTRVALVLTLALSFAAWPKASIDDDVVPAVWPLDAGWSDRLKVGETISLVIADSQLLVVEPKLLTARALGDGATVWKSEIAPTASPVADEGHIFIPAADGIHSLSAATGTEEWRLPGKVAFAPTARSGWLIVPGEDSSLQGVSTKDGREVWRILLPAPLTGSVAIDGDLVVGGCADGVIRAWQIADGAVRWTRETGTKPTQVLAANGRVFVGGEDGRLMSLGHQDGRLIWAYAFKMSITGRLAMDADHVYATTIDNSARAHTFNGHQKWRKELAFRVIDGLFSDSGRVFVPQSNGEIRMFVAKNGVRAGRLNASPQNALVIGGLAVTGSGAQLRMALTAEAGAGSEIVLTTYRREGIAAVPAKSAPSSTPLLLTLPGGRP